MADQEDPNREDGAGGSGSPGPEDRPEGAASNQEQDEGLVPAEVADSYFGLLEDYPLGQDMSHLRIGDDQTSVLRPESLGTQPAAREDRVPALESGPEKGSLETGDAMPRETSPGPDPHRRIRGAAERERARREARSRATGGFARSSPLSQFLCELCGFECRWLGKYQRHLATHMWPPQ